ncbi:MAG: ThiF family adenylyltransferase, partial [Candidatus Micrarchaeia archaeon]
MDYFSFFEKNIGVLSLEEQNKLKNSKVAIIGLGGIGGIALEVLARTGIENFVICDKDKFEPSNFNRQILATLDFIGKSKVQAGLKRLKKINKNVKVKVFGKMEKKNVMKIIDGVDVVVDGLDNLRDRIILARACRKKKIPYVFGSAARDIGMST